MTVIRTAEKAFGWLKNVHAWAGPTRAKGPGFDVVDDLKRIQVPTLVVTGRRDLSMSVNTATRLHEGIAGSSIIVLEHSGHMGHLDEPTAFARAIAGFVPSLGGTSIMSNGNRPLERVRAGQ